MLMRLAVVAVAVALSAGAWSSGGIGGEVSRLMVPVAAPAARRVSWYWRIWYVVNVAARASRPKKAARWAARPRAVLWDRNCRT